MMTHTNYFEIEADTSYELGMRKGELFGEPLRETLDDLKTEKHCERPGKQAIPYRKLTEKLFPHLIEELKGYADAARVSFDDLWLLCIEDELPDSANDKCTTFVTNYGFLVAHNEDWNSVAKDEICILRQTVGDLTVFQLFYLNTLGGNSISINSHGFVHAVNTLTHTDRRVGVPRNIVARWLSETRSPESDYSKLQQMKRASGYHRTGGSSREARLPTLLVGRAPQHRQLRRYQP